MEKIIKISLATLFFLCLADMPYGYYQFVRFAGLIGFAILAYQANQQGRQKELIIYVGLAFLFQPFFKIALGRQMWNIVDGVVGIGLLISVFINSRKSQPKSKHICNSHKPMRRPKIAKELALPTHQNRHDMTTSIHKRKEGRSANSGFAKKRVQWLIKHTTSHQLLCWVDSFVPRNPARTPSAKTP